MKADSTTAAADPAPQPTTPAPVERHPAGRRRAIEAHRQPPGPEGGPGIAAAVERQTGAMRKLSRHTFPETPSVPDKAPAPIAQARPQRRHRALATDAAPLHRVSAYT
ncbi:hypothetical protein [Streptomyces uncialis]|uniref:hypothetical protein n=1 Tax=Streptomyces uncialis TaxID=1048205 RepID=UPI003868D87A|nr:hypothetical protein OG268_05995 [Streptomyces uncialis]